MRLWWSLSQQLKPAYLSKAVNRVLLWKQSDYMRKCFGCWFRGDRSSNHQQLHNTCARSALIRELRLLSTSFLLLNHTFANWLGTSLLFERTPLEDGLDTHQKGIHNLQGFHAWWQIAHGRKNRTFIFHFLYLNLQNQRVSIFTRTKDDYGGHLDGDLHDTSKHRLKANTN